MKKLLTVLFSSAMVLSVTTFSFAQDAGTAKEDDTKKADAKPKTAPQENDRQEVRQEDRR
jgi:hypothetical protein